MKKKLLLRLIIGYIIFGILGFTAVAVFTAQYNENYVRENTAASLHREASLIASSYASGNFSSQLTLNEFQRQLSAISTYLDADIYVVDNTGTILVSSLETSYLNNQKKISDFDILDFSSGYYTLSDFYTNYSESMLCVYSPITYNYRASSYVLLCMPDAHIMEMKSGLLDGAYLTLLIVYALSLLILLICFLSVHLPVKKLIRAAMHYNHGDYDYPLAIHQNDELGYIAASFNYMRHELGTLEEDQRKFVSNVSHDFRSPLTSIKGYAQAMADGTIPPQMQERYLQVIIFETERLEKLTQELLELNQYGSRGYLLDITSFDLNQTIKMTVQTFEQISLEKQIRFDLILTGNELYVDADISKIQLVLQNLIDNAIKFSHTSSAIKIETTVKNDKVFISVKDHGIGIPKESIGKIWERFYKTDISRGKDKKGTGLGLAIVKEILNAHHENINVISTIEVGTEFIFTLPLSKSR